ncbi:MAG: hypothetical protein FKY71_08100 [Spiribacter salinus]|uniref:Uncharacterized protein n=1 Tax=Spiribacter salinus TaxID=1335746 RepID=A0A540VRX3_9GAMM|nr:MAG: hypothetical protein FKY71_08100 [Spiribacter salinus]
MKRLARWEIDEKSRRFGRFCFNCLTAQRILGFDRHFESDNPITVAKVDVFKGWHRVCLVASMVGVQEDDQLTLIGRESHLDRMVHDLQAYGLQAPLVERGFLGEWELPRSDKADRELRDVWQRLTARNKLRHAVAQMHPELRVWPGEREYAPKGDEVQLRKNFKKVKLGGCV